MKKMLPSSAQNCGLVIASGRRAHHEGERADQPDVSRRPPRVVAIGLRRGCAEQEVRGTEEERRHPGARLYGLTARVSSSPLRNANGLRMSGIRPVSL